MKITDIGKVLEWASAIYAWDYAEPEPLAELLKAGPIPDEFRAAIADIITGERTPNKKAGSKLKMPASEHGKIVHDLMMARLWRDGFTLDSAYIAADRRMEPLEIIQELREEYRARLADIAQRYNVSFETIENLARNTEGYLTAKD